jgi:curved DNA-binding protein CbpA
MHGVRRVFASPSFTALRRVGTQASLDFHRNVLGIAHGADSSAIKAAFRQKAKESHPDCGGSAFAFRQLRESYEIVLEHTLKSVDMDRRSVKDGDRDAKDGMDRMPTVREFVALGDFDGAWALWKFLEASGVRPLSVPDVEGVIALMCTGSGGSGLDGAAVLVQRLHAEGHLPTDDAQLSLIYNTLLWQVGKTQDFDRILAFLNTMDAAGVTFD